MLRIRKPCFEVLTKLEDYGHRLQTSLEVSRPYYRSRQAYVTVNDWQDVLQYLVTGVSGWVEEDSEDCDDDSGAMLYFQGQRDWISEDNDFSSGDSEESDDDDYII